MDLANKTVLLTGATGGIGQAIAHVLAKKGARLLLVARNEAKIQHLRNALVTDYKLDSSHSPAMLSADLTTETGRQALVAFCEKNGLDILINNAGYQDFGLYAEQSALSVEQTVMVNLLAPMLLTQALLPTLQQSQAGAIVNIGSTFGSIGHPAYVSYCASKFGLRGFSESLRRELADSTLSVHYLAPRATQTELNSTAVTAMNDALGNAIDAPQLVATELVAQLQKTTGGARYLGWPEKLFVRINGLLPALVDNALRKNLATIKQYATTNTKRT
jgi:short-subunit dehydrogenase